MRRKLFYTPDPAFFSLNEEQFPCPGDKRATETGSVFSGGALPAQGCGGDCSAPHGQRGEGCRQSSEERPRGTQGMSGWPSAGWWQVPQHSAPLPPAVYDRESTAGVRLALGEGLSPCRFGSSAAPVTGTGTRPTGLLPHLRRTCLQSHC